MEVLAAEDHLVGFINSDGVVQLVGVGGGVEDGLHPDAAERFVELAYTARLLVTADDDARAGVQRP